MRTLIAPTEDFIKLERTAISADVSAGSSVTITVDNTDGISANDYVAIGIEGSELCELQQVSSVPSNTSIIVSTLKFNHKKNEPVTKYRYNQRKFYGSETEGGTYAEITGDGSPVNIQVDDPQGTILEYTSDTYLYFKATYYNATTGDETDTADSEEVAGDQSGRYSSLYGIRKHAGLVGNPFYSDQRIEKKRQQAESEINSYLQKRYTLPLSEVPGIVTYICELLGAGYIDYEEFGKEGEGLSWLKEARSMLEKIAGGKMVLTTLSGAEMTLQSNNIGRLQGYPDETISSADSDFRIFQIDDRY